MDLVKIAEEAFACGKEHPSFVVVTLLPYLTVSKRVTKSVSSNSAEMLSVSRVTVTKSISTVRKMSGNVRCGKNFPHRVAFHRRDCSEPSR